MKLATNNPERRKRAKAKAQFRVGKTEPPDFLGTTAKAEWGRIIGELVRTGLYTEVDRPALVAYCAAYGLMVDASEFIRVEGTTYVVRDKDGAVKSICKFPQVAILERSLESVRKLADAFGLTPASRGRVTTQPPDEIDDLLLSIVD